MGTERGPHCSDAVHVTAWRPIREDPSAIKVSWGPPLPVIPLHPTMALSSATYKGGPRSCSYHSSWRGSLQIGDSSHVHAATGTLPLTAYTSYPRRRKKSPAEYSAPATSKRMLRPSWGWHGMTTSLASPPTSNFARTWRAASRSSQSASQWP